MVVGFGAVDEVLYSPWAHANADGTRKTVALGENEGRLRTACAVQRANYDGIREITGHQRYVSWDRTSSRPGSTV